MTSLSPSVSRPMLLKVRGAKGHDTWRESTYYAAAATEAELMPLLEKAWARGFDAEITWATDLVGMDEYLDKFHEEYR